MNVAWIGFHMEGLPALQAIAEAGYPVKGVITLTQEAAARRSGTLSYDETCARLGIPLYKVRNINEPESVNLLRSLDLDLAFVIGWSQILRPEALRTARIGMIGAHASLLPRHRGRAPVNWAIIRGETETGNSLIWLDPEVDRGDIIDQARIPISPYDTCQTIYEHVAESNRVMILRALGQLSKGVRPGLPQPETTEPLLPGRTPKDGVVDWRRGAPEVYNFIRALTRPYPGAFSTLDEMRWVLWQAALLPGRKFTGAPGEIVGPMCSSLDGACGQVVACGEGSLVLLEVEDENGRMLRGHRLSEQDWTGRIWDSAGP